MVAPTADPAPRRWALLALVLTLTAVAQAWTLPLSFQLDDYALLWRPLELFRLGTEHETAEVPRFALRWTSWTLWAALDGLLPKPRTELPYHLVGLGLHVLCTGLLFAIARRLAPFECHRERELVGLVAALWFGVQAGGAQAHSWISAWGGLTAAACSLMALRAFVVARERDVEGRLATRWPLAVWTLLALLSKTPALALPPLLAWLALCLAPRALDADRDGRRRRTRELTAALGALAIGLAIRALYLGNARPRYGDRRPLDLADIPRVLWSGLENLAQGLIATNHDALVADHEPWLAAGAAPMVGLGLMAVVFGLLLVVLPRRRRTAIGLFGALVAAGGPAGAIYGGIANNLMARTTYFPMALFAVAIGIASIGLGRSGPLGRLGPRLRIAFAVVLVVLWAPGRQSVVVVERLADAERRQHRGALTTAAERVGEAGLIVLREPPDGFVGVPQLGSLLHGVLLPSYWDGPRPELVRCTNDRQLRAALGDGALRGRTVAVVVPRGEDDQSPPGMRAARELVDRWSRSESWPAGPQVDWCELERGDGRSALRFAGPMPPFGFAGLSFEPRAAGRVRIAYLDPAGVERRALELDVVPGAAVPVASPRALGFRLGGPLGAIELTGAPVEDPRVLFELPTVAVDAAWMAGELVLDRETPLPPIAIRRPAGWSLPPIARLTMRVQRTVGETEVYADALLDPDPRGPVPFVLELVHIAPDARPGDPAVFRASWPEAVDRLRELIDNAQGAPSGPVTWLVELLHPDGTPAAVSRPVRGRYRLADGP